MAVQREILAVPEGDPQCQTKNPQTSVLIDHPG